MLAIHGSRFLLEVELTVPSKLLKECVLSLSWHSHGDDEEEEEEDDDDDADEQEDDDYDYDDDDDDEEEEEEEDDEDQDIFNHHHFEVPNLKSTPQNTTKTRYVFLLPAIRPYLLMELGDLDLMPPVIRARGP